MRAPAAAVRTLAVPFFDEQPSAPIYVAECCHRLYVGRVPPTKCRTCPNLPAATAIASRADLDRLFPL